MIVAFTDPGVHPASADFYRTFPWEPVASHTDIRIAQVHEIRNLTMERILDDLPTTAGRNGTVVIIFHGTSLGLSMPLTSSNRRVHANAQVMGLLDGSRPDQEVAQALLFGDPRNRGAQRVRALREKMQAVKDLDLDRVELRACNTGTNTGAMQTAKRFFGADRLGAPDLRDAFFRVNPGRPHAGASFWQRWLRQHARNKVYEVPAHGRFALAVQERGHSSFSASALANNPSAPGFWVDVYLSRLRPTPYSGRGSFPAHALWSSTTSFPLILPGDDDYVGHIIHV